MTETEIIEVRAKLYTRLEEMAENEDMGFNELIDHILRSYVETFDVDEDATEAECEAEDA